MARPVLAYHLIISAYGFWLPNDPRGSWSDFVRSWELLRHGRATKTSARHSLAHVKHDSARRNQAKRSLKLKPVKFDGPQARAIGRGFADYFRRSGAICFACAILPDHVHLVIARHTCAIEMLANLIKGAATRQLHCEALHPFKDAGYANGRLPSPWARNQWACFLDSEEDIRRSIRYANANPAKDHLAYQHWNFVRRFDAAVLEHM